ncbi:probable disease resistance RPP8-like protein 2 [Cornus florida]|uniref:probable disease resistance RPP8-like protein 2 n=1 Tax=Cornus florida TaxID=4283 RepID=UPI0028A290EF|nr:probable disease resistance RPP8-like protein 2 [Cornus florida]
MEELGWKMVRNCGGLPLAIVVLGGILVTKHTAREWEMVHGNINSYMSKGIGVGQQHRGVSQVLALSYDDLPYELKRCFLYLGSFPEDSQINLEKLYQLWMAEDLVLLDDVGGEDTIMDVGERYLSELAQRYTVQLGVQEEDFSFGRFQNCSLHDRMREVCLSKNKEENFLNVFDFGKRKGTKPLDSSCSSSSSNAKVRRIVIHLGNEEDYKDDPRELVSNFEHVTTQGHLRSVLIFGDDRLIMDSHFKYLKVLTVLHLEGVKLVGFPKAVGKLIHLRYLNLRNCELQGKLSSSIGNLRCLQTLDLRDNYANLIIPNVLWKIKKLNTSIS